MACYRAAHGHAMGDGLHRGDTGIRRRTSQGRRAPTRAALAPTRLRRDDPGLRRSPVAHRLGEERRPGFLRDLLRRGRRDPERGRAARPTTPDPVRADPQRLRQPVRDGLRPFVLSATGRAPAGRRRDPDGRRGPGRRRAVPVPQELWLHRPDPGARGGGPSPAAGPDATPPRLLLDRGARGVDDAADAALRGGGRRGRRRRSGACHGGERGDVPRLAAADARRLADRRAVRRVRDPPHLQARAGLAAAPAQAAPARPLERRLPLSRAHRGGRQRRGPRDATGGAARAASAPAPRAPSRRSSGVRSRSRRRCRSRWCPEARRASRASPWTRARAGR